MQPYNLAREQGKDARHFALAVLSSLQNADKHRQLIFSKPGLSQMELIVNGVVVDCSVKSIYDGTQVAELPPNVEVITKGALVIPFSVGDYVGYGFPDVFNMILNDIAQGVLPPLEALLRRP